MTAGDRRPARGKRKGERLTRRFHEDFPITALLLILVLGFYVLEVLAQNKVVDDPWAPEPTPMNIHVDVFTPLGGLIPRLTVEGKEVWRLLSAVFLHGGLIHLFFNGLILYDLGRFCEPLLSSAKLFTVFVICGLGGSLARCFYVYALAPEWLGRPSVGASGALAGLIGILLVYSIKERHNELTSSLVRWIALIVLVTILVPAVDHAAHIGGFVTGCALGLTVKDYMTSAAAARWRIPAWIAGAVLAAALGAALWSYFSQIWGNG